MSLNLSEKDFDRLSTFITSEFGIKMPATKMTMLVSRLSKRLRALRMSDFKQYCDFLFSPEGMPEEMVHLVNAITTNKTDFFREPSHFNYLIEKSIPVLQSRKHCNSRHPLRVWSAGCSSGEEPYTLAMVLSNYSEAYSGFRFEILATDICTQVLEIAKRAIYPIERIAPVAFEYKKKYILKGGHKRSSEIRMAPEIRSVVRFGHLNFMDNDFRLPYSVDIIFCRNVIIYFDRKTQEQLILKLSKYLSEGGYLFLGHSESLHVYETPFTQVAPTIYRKHG